MSNETKRDVVEAILLAKDTDTIWDSSTVRYYLNRYDAALPDDLPTIPFVVSEEIKGSHDSLSLRDELESVDSTSDDFLVVDYIENSESVFAEAWIRGLWIVDENGEIVRL